MKDYSSFEVLGPIMIGPSSSHTAGAARLGNIAKNIAQANFKKVEFHLHGSFAKTYRGHGTDKALVAGILGYEPDDERIINSFELAQEANIEIEFIEADLGYQHPNTVKIVFKYDNGDDFYVLGSSIGGGSVVIYDINGDEMEFTGDHPTILLKYYDRKGVIMNISSILSNSHHNIGKMNVSRDGNIATMTLELDSSVDDDSIESISSLEDIFYLRYIDVTRSELI